MPAKKSKKRVAKTTAKVTKRSSKKSKVSTKKTKGSSNKAKGSSNKAKGSPKQAKGSSKVANFFISQLKFWVLRFCIIFAIALFGYTVYSDSKIREKFEGQKWALPAHVYTRPLELYIGQQLDVALLREELNELGYVARTNADRVGSYYFSESKIDIYQREFRFWDGLQKAQLTTLE